jgi:antitoxin HicB
MATNANKKKLTYYLGLSYPVTHVETEDGVAAWLPDLPGCITQGDTVEEALENVADAKRAWLETALNRGVDIPLPGHAREYSGKLLLRMARTLHRALSEKAEKEGVSLNQYITYLLADALKGEERAAFEKEIISRLESLAAVPALKR